MTSALSVRDPQPGETWSCNGHPYRVLSVSAATATLEDLGDGHPFGVFVSHMTSAQGWEKEGAK